MRLSQDMLVDVSSIETYQSASNLHKQPFFHIYWTDCQVRATKESSIFFLSSTLLKHDFNKGILN